jgi:type II secretory pathway pseudopilin PulG
MTLVELTAVILVVMSLLTITFIGATTWKRGADRANCVANIRKVQLAVRGYANLNGFWPGDDLSMESPPLNLESEIFGPEKMLDRYPLCPSSGIYGFSGHTVPPLGTLFMRCSLELDREHTPSNFSGW